MSHREKEQLANAAARPMELFWAASGGQEMKRASIIRGSPADCNAIAC
jgi:hypothetical protein